MNITYMSGSTSGYDLGAMTEEDLIELMNSSTAHGAPIHFLTLIDDEIRFRRFGDEVSFYTADALAGEPTW